MDDSIESRQGMVLGRYLLTTMLLDLKLSENVIISGAAPYEGFLATIFDINCCGFKSLTEKLSNRRNPS